MSVGNQDSYKLTRDKVESDRLDEQHERHIANFGYVIHPNVMKRLPPNARIADVGTGTGAWLLHAARILPEGAQLRGFDISSAQFPTGSPENVKFEVLDAKVPFPEDERDRYDLVHLRALIAALEPPDWLMVMANAVQLLKPGGAVQWAEGNLSRIPCMRETGEYYQFVAIPRLLDAWADCMGDRLADGWQKLQEAVAQQGLRNVEFDVVSTDRVPSLRKQTTRSYMTALLGWAGKSAIWPPEDVQALKTAIDLEIENGAYTRGDVMTVVGWKPVPET